MKITLKDLAETPCNRYPVKSWERNKTEFDPLAVIDMYTDNIEDQVLDTIWFMGNCTAKMDAVTKNRVETTVNRNPSHNSRGYYLADYLDTQYGDDPEGYFQTAMKFSEHADYMKPVLVYRLFESILIDKAKMELLAKKISKLTTVRLCMMIPTDSDFRWSNMELILPNTEMLRSVIGDGLQELYEEYRYNRL